MNTKDKQKFFQALFIFLIISLILFMVWMFFWVSNSGGECVRDPLKFYGEKTNNSCDQEIQNYELICTPKNISNLMITDLYP